MINYSCSTRILSVWSLPFHLRTPRPECQIFRGIQTAKRAAAWGSSVLPRHIPPNAVKEIQVSGLFRKALISLSGSSTAFPEYWPCFSWRCLWGGAEVNGMRLCSFLEEVQLSCKPEAWAGLFRRSRPAGLTDAQLASSSGTRTVWIRIVAGDAPVWHQPSLLDQGRCWLLRGGQEQLPLVNLFCAFISLLLAVSCHWLSATAHSPSPVPSRHAQPVPTSLPAAGPTSPPQLAAAPYCGNYYLWWIFSVHYVSRVQYHLSQYQVPTAWAEAHGNTPLFHMYTHPTLMQGWTEGEGSKVAGTY